MKLVDIFEFTEMLVTSMLFALRAVNSKSRTKPYPLLALESWTRKMLTHLNLLSTVTKTCKAGDLGIGEVVIHVGEIALFCSMDGSVPRLNNDVMTLFSSTKNKTDFDLQMFLTFVFSL